jgi:hypothetical protein
MIAAPAKISQELVGHWTMAGRSIKLDANVAEGYSNLQSDSDAGLIFALWVVPLRAPALKLIQRSLQQLREIHGTIYYEPDSDYPSEYCNLLATKPYLLFTFSPASL